MRVAKHCLHPPLQSGEFAGTVKNTTSASVYPEQYTDSWIILPLFYRSSPTRTEIPFGTNPCCLFLFSVWCLFYFIQFLFFFYFLKLMFNRWPLISNTWHLSLINDHRLTIFANVFIRWSQKAALPLLAG